MSIRPSPQTTTISAPGPDLTRPPWHQPRRDHHVLGWGVVSVEPRKEQPGGGPPQRGWILSDHGDRRIEQVGQLNVIEADECDVAMEPQLLERPHGSDRDEVLRGEERRRGILRGDQVGSSLFGRPGAADVPPEDRGIKW